MQKITTNQGTSVLDPLGFDGSQNYLVNVSKGLRNSSSTYERIDLNNEKLTEWALAQITLEKYSEVLRWNHSKQSWSGFDKATGLWTTHDTEKIFHLVLSVIAVMREGEADKIKHSGVSRSKAIQQIERAESKKFLSGVEGLMRTDPMIRVENQIFDSNPYLIGLLEGQCLDLKTCEVRHIAAEDYLTKTLGTAYDPYQKCPLWEKSILEWCRNDPELVAFLQKWVAYSLSGLTEVQKFLFLHGSGKNGKSCFLKILTSLSGPYWVNLRAESLMQQNRGVNASPDIAKLAGVRLVTSSELPDGCFFDENLMKQLTGGDAITARHLYATEFDFTPQLKLIIAGNHKPIVKGTDNGFWRRFLLIPFRANITEVDYKLTDKLLQELPGILNWCIDGWKSYQMTGLESPKVVIDSSNEYKDDMDLMLQWKRDCLQESNGSRLSARSLFLSYQDWAKCNGYRPLGSKSFYRSLSDYLGDPKRTSDGNFYLNYLFNNSEHGGECSDVGI